MLGINTIDEYARRPFRYQNIDGIGQLGVGLLWIGMGAMQALQATASDGSIWHRRGIHLTAVVAFGLIVLYGMWALRRRITFPRTGFVKYRGLGKPSLGGLLAAAIAAPVSIFYYFLLRHSSVSLTLALGCAGFALLYAFATRMDAAWEWIVLVMMVTGPVAISTLPIDRELNQGLSIGFLGLTLFVSGAITLYLYLHRTRPPEEGAAQ